MSGHHNDCWDYDTANVGIVTPAQMLSVCHEFVDGTKTVQYLSLQLSLKHHYINMDLQHTEK